MSLPGLDLASLFDASPNPYLVLDRDLNIAGANRAYLASTRRELSEVVGRWAWEAFPTDRETERLAIASFRKVIATREADTMGLLHFDVPRPEAEGGGFEERRWNLIHSPVLDAEGEVAFVLQDAKDVTEEQLAKAALRTTESEARGVLEGMGEGFILLDPDFRVRRINAEGLRIDGSPLEATVGRHLLEVWPETKDLPTWPLYQRSMADRQPRSVTYRHRSDVHDVWLEVRVYPSPHGLAVFYRDVTAAQQPQEHLRASEARFGAALGIETVGAIFLDMEGRILDANDAFLRLVDYSRADLEAGQLSWQELTPPEWVEASERAMAELQATGTCTPYEKEYFRRDGSRVRALFAAKLLPDGTGFEVVLDITDRKAAEARAATLVRLSDRLRDLDDPGEIAFAAAQILGEALGATHVGCAEMDDSGLICAEDDWISPAIVPVIWPIRFRTPESIFACLRRGEAVVIADVTSDERSAPVGSLLEARNGRTIVLAPVIERGRLTSVLFVKDRRTRAWTDEEVALIQEVANRTRTAVERARTSLALREAQEVLRRANEELEARVAERTAERDRVWRLSRDLLVVVGPGGVFQAVNPAFRAILGFEPEEVVGRRFLDFVFPEDVGQALTDLQAALAHPDVAQIEMRYRHKDGSPRWISWLTSVEGDLVFATGRDITAEKDRQARLEAAEAARREADALYRAYFQNSTEGLFSIAVRPDGDFSVEEVNPAYEAAVGVGARGKLGQRLEEQFGPEVAAMVRPNYQRAIATGQVQRYRETVEMEGRLFQVETVLVPVRDEPGQITRIMGSARDMSAQAQLEASELARREADALYRAYFQNSNEGLFVIGVLPDGGFVIEEVNPAHEAAMGIPLEEMRGKRMEELFPPEVVEHVCRNYRRAIEAGSPVRYRESAELKGRMLHFDTILVPVRDTASGRITRIVGSGRDMTAQVEAEAARRRADALYRAYFQNSTETLFVIAVLPDGGFSIEDANPAHEATVGLRKAGKLGLPLEEQISAELVEQISGNYRRVVESGTVERYMEEIPFNGRRLYSETVLVPVRDEDGRITRLMGSSRDMTAQVEAEEKLRQSQKLESMGQLTGGVAHDFNNLLAPIMSTLDRIQWKGLGDEIDQRLVDGALQSAERARVLVQRLLAFARRQPLQPKAVDVGDVVRGMAELVASTAGPQIQVSVAVEEGLPPAMADANQLEMAILNLAINARDAMPDGGDLRLTAGNETVGEGHDSGAPPGSYVRPSVADTGVGMDEVTLKRAVEPFFSTKGVGRGTGLGLSMAHGLAAQLGGVLTLRSTPGVGTNVELWLPVANQPAQAKPAAETRGRGPVAAAGVALLVDDEELVRAAAAFTLQDLGYEVVEAASAEEALERLEEGLAPDLLVTDHLMPGMSGADLVRSLRERRPGLPALLVSGYANLTGVAPDVPRLNKPFRSSELAAAVAKVTGKAA